MTQDIAPPPTTEEKRFDLQQKITDTIIQKLNNGIVPWHQPWISKSDSNFTIPMNVQSGNHYNGINILLLWGDTSDKKFSSNEWGTFKQWKGLDQTIRKDEKGTMIFYYDTYEKEVEGEIKKLPFLKYATVFNKCQLEGFDPLLEDVPEPVSLVEINKTAETFVQNTGAKITHKGNKACYNKKTDSISMPPVESFIETANASATEGYYSVLFHELTHWTGHENRLERKFGKVFGDEQYAVEELIAELGATFMCSELGITKSNIDNSAAYINHWLKKLQDNKYLITTAAGEASKSVKFLHQLQPK